MSLIQAALDKASQTQTTTKAAAPQTAVTAAVTANRPDRVPADDRIENELRAIQERHHSQRLAGWIVAAVIALLVVVSAAVLLFLGPKGRAVKAEPKNVFLPVSLSLPRPGFRLSGITNLGDMPRAIINDRIVMAGDAVSGNVTVKEIRAKEVILDDGGKDLVLKM
jgi:hypothetical protein